MAEEKEKKGFFARLKAGLAKTRDNIVESFTDVFGIGKVVVLWLFVRLPARLFGNDSFR